MHQRSLVRIAAPLLVAAIALTGCGSRSGGSSASGDAASGSNKVAVIGVIAPLTGDLSALGLGIKNSADLAIKKANEEKLIPGWTLKMQAEDDQATPATGQQAASKLAGTPDVVGVVGNLNSNVAQSVQPVLDKANITMVSPANTNPTLTQGADPNNKKRPYHVYFRTATTDAIQGPFAANYVFNDLGIKQVATVHDQKTYGQGLVAAFTAQFKKLGGTIVAAETINPQDQDYSSTIAKLKAKGPKLVYYGGEYPQAGPLSQQMKSAGLDVPVMGGDGIYDPKFITLAGASANGDLATSVGAPPEKLASAKQFLADYKAAGYSDPYAAYGAYAYDAAWAIIQALKQVLPNETKIDESVRQKVVAAMANVSFDGVTGHVSFDQYGDATSKVLTVYKVDNNQWVAAKTGEFK